MSVRIEERLMAEFAVQANDNKVVGIRKDDFIQQLLLFDHVIIPTIWLDDVRLLTHSCDLAALTELVENGALSFYIDSSTIGETGQLSPEYRNDRRAILPWNEFEISIIRGRDDEERRQQGLLRIANDPLLSKSDRHHFVEALDRSFHKPCGMELHAEANKLAVQRLTTSDAGIIEGLFLPRLHKLGLKPKKFRASVSQINDGHFRIDTNLQKQGLSRMKERQISMRVLLDFFGAFIRVKHMEKFQCITAMGETDANAWEATSSALARDLLAQADSRDSFKRVVRLAGLGESALVNEGVLDLSRLLNVRQSSELRDFRTWLKHSGDLSDSQVRERLRSLRNKLGNGSQSTFGKIVRFITTNFASSLIGDPLLAQSVSTVVSGIDTFAWDHLFPRDSVSYIVGKQYAGIMGCKRDR